MLEKLILIYRLWNTDIQYFKASIRAQTLGNVKDTKDIQEITGW